MAEEACKKYLEAGWKDGKREAHLMALPAYEQCIKASHVFNLLDARDGANVTVKFGTIDAAYGRASLTSARRAIRAAGARLFFLPPYSPDLNPIEMAFSKLKPHLRARAVRTIDELWKAIGQICDLFQPDECKNYFTAAGYGFT